MIGWLQGKDYKELANLYFEGKTETVVKKLEKVTHAFAWGFNSLISHIAFYLNSEKSPSIFQSLTSFVTHGVSTTAAVYAISLGVHNRQIAIKVGNAFQSIYPETEYSSFKKWLFNLNFDQWKEIVKVQEEEIDKIKECFANVQQKQKKLEKTSIIFECSLVGNNDFTEIYELVDKNNLIIVNCDEYLWLTTYNYQNFWQLGGANIDKLKQFDRQIHDFIVSDVDQQRRIVSISVY